MEKPRVVILGGGFAGVSVARHLFAQVKNGDISLTLVNNSPDFLFTPLLHEVATGSLSSASVAESLFDIFQGTNARLVIASVTAIRREEKKIVTSDESIAYDILVIATGARSSFAIEGGEYAYALKTLADANAIRSKMITLMHLEKHPNIVVIGSGPTAIETVAELSEYAKQLHESRNTLAKNQTMPKVSLLTSSKTVPAQFPHAMQIDTQERLRELDIDVIEAKAKTILSDSIETESGDIISSHLTILTIGVLPNIPLAIPSFDLHASGRLLVTDEMHLPNDTTIFALGDVASRNQSDQMLAQIATQQAQTVAENILRIIHYQALNTFKPQLKGLLVSLGAWHATAQIGKIHLRGRFAWWLWRTVYFFKFHSHKKRLRIAFEWTANVFFDRDSTSIHHGTKI